MKKLVAIVLVAMLALPMACFAQAKDKTTVTLWHTFTGAQLAMIDTLVEEFNASSDAFTVVAEAFPNSGFDSKVQTAIANGEGPDIIFHYSSEAANYIDGQNPENNLIVDFGQYIHDPEIGIEGWDTGMDKVLLDETVGFDDGLMHAIPLVRTGPILFYNKTILDELNLAVPTTWAELAETAKAITEAKGIYGFATDSLADMMQALILQNGSEYIDVAAKEAKINNPITVDAAAWYGDNVKAGYFAPAPTSDYYSNDMNSQLLGMYIGSCAGVPYLLAEENGWELGMAAMPLQGTQRWYPAWNRSAIAFKSTQARELGAYLFIKFFVAPENNVRWCTAMIALSPYYATHKMEGYQDLVDANVALQVVQSCLPDAGFLPTVYGASTIRDELKALAQMAGDANLTTPIADLVAAAEITCTEKMQDN